MKNKKMLGMFGTTLAILALIVGPGMNFAFAKHGDSDNSGPGNSNSSKTAAPVSVSAASTVTALENHSNRGRNHDEDENENEDNNDVAALEARIVVLEAKIVAQEARILALEKKVGIVDVVAPTISATTSTNIGAGAATITWTTNESATSKVYFSTTNPVNLATATVVSDPALLLNHSVNLSGLSANTTYFFVVESKDAAGNTSTSPQQSFLTLP